MRFHISLFVAASTAALIATTSFAQALLPPPTPDQIARLAAVARDNLGMARLSDGSLVPAETPDELTRPIIPEALVQQTIARGYLTGEMEACGMEWQEGSFLPYMSAIRGSQRYSGKQMAYVGMLHGIGQGTAASEVAKRLASCPKAHIERLEATVRNAPTLTP